MKGAIRRILVDSNESADRDRTETAPEVAYKYLRDAILSRKIDYGASLRQEDLAERTGISRQPIREALRRLESEGLVVFRPRRGYCVASLNKEEIDDILDVVSILEERAGYFAALRRGEADVAELAAIQEKIEQLGEKWSSTKPEEFSRLNALFHARLIAVSKRPYLIKLLGTLQNKVEHYARIATNLEFDLNVSRQEHHAILNAFRAGDAEAVGLLCRAHRRNTARRLLDYLNADDVVSSTKRSAKTRHRSRSNQPLK
jgi:DNA-binding GntR family transcriptional regulator